MKKRKMMNPKTIKILFLALLTGILSFLFFYFLNQGIILGNLGSAWPIILTFLFLLIFIVLEVVFIADLNLLISLVCIQSLLSIIAFVSSFNNLPFLLICFAILFLFSFWGVKKGHSNIKNGLEINFFSSVHRVIPKVFTGILLFMVIVLYFNYVNLGNLDERLGRQVFDKIVNSLEPLLQIWVPDTSLDMEIGEALEEAARTQLQRSKIELLKEGINLDEISDSQMQELIDEAALQIESRVEEVAGNLRADQTIREFAYSAIKGRVDAMSPTGKKLLGGLVLLIPFFIIKGIALLIYPIVELLAFLIYQILLMFGFAYIGLETKQKEVINLS